MQLDVEIQSHEFAYREGDPGDQWDMGEFGLRLDRVSVRETLRTGDASLDVSPGDEVVVLIEHYSDGCTFGSSEYLELKGVFHSVMDAVSFAGTINTSHGYFGRHISFLYEECIVGRAACT